MRYWFVVKYWEMRNWFVVKHWKMRSSLLFFANFPGYFMRNCDVVYGICSRIGWFLCWYNIEGGCICFVFCFSRVQVLKLH